MDGCAPNNTVVPRVALKAISVLASGAKTGVKCLMLEELPPY